MSEEVEEAEEQSHRGLQEGPFPDDPYIYDARPDIYSKYQMGVIDGDTYDMFIDQGFNDFTRERIRPYHINTGEVFGVSHDSQEYQRGMVHKQFAIEWFREKIGSPFDVHVQNKWPLRIRTYHAPAGWGRWMADIYHKDGDSLSQALYHEFGDEVLSKKYPPKS